MCILFEEPIKVKKIKSGVYAYQYRSGVIVIEGTQYIMHSLTSAISAYRRQGKNKNA